MLTQHSKETATEIQTTVSSSDSVEPPVMHRQLSDSAEAWSVEDVGHFFRQFSSLKQYCAAVVKNDVDGPLLLNLCNQDRLSDLGITQPIHQVKVKAELDKSRLVQLSSASLQSSHASTLRQLIRPLIRQLRRQLCVN